MLRLIKDLVSKVKPYKTNGLKKEQNNTCKAQRSIFDLTRDQ